MHYWHKHGDDITVYATHALARASAAGIARQFWGELTGRPDVRDDVPASPDDLSDEEAASVYFGELEEHEGYEITQTTVIGAGGDTAAGLETCQAWRTGLGGRPTRASAPGGQHRAATGPPGKPAHTPPARPAWGGLPPTG
jgi:hypothetical protein